MFENFNVCFCVPVPPHPLAVYFPPGAQPVRCGSDAGRRLAVLSVSAKAALAVCLSAQAGLWNTPAHTNHFLVLAVLASTLRVDIAPVFGATCSNATDAETFHLVYVPQLILVPLCGGIRLYSFFGGNASP